MRACTFTPPLIYTPRERLADLIIHVIGVSAGLIAAPVLLASAWLAGNVRLLIGVSFYAAGLVLILSLSAAYNLVIAPRMRERLRIADHIAVYIMIAGTYSPLALGALSPSIGNWVFAYIWAVSLVGVTLKIIRPRQFERFAIFIYLALGWTFVLLRQPLAGAMPPVGLWLLAIGAGFYSIGVGFHLDSGLPFHNAIWHALVLAAAACHYVAIFLYVAKPALS